MKLNWRKGSIWVSVYHGGIVKLSTSSLWFSFFKYGSIDIFEGDFVVIFEGLSLQNFCEWIWNVFPMEGHNFMHKLCLGGFLVYLWRISQQIDPSQKTCSPLKNQDFNVHLEQGRYGSKMCKHVIMDLTKILRMISSWTPIFIFHLWRSLLMVLWACLVLKPIQPPLKEDLGFFLHDQQKISTRLANL